MGADIDPLTETAYCKYAEREYNVVMRTLTEKQIIEALWDMVAQNGSQGKVAEILNITPAYLNDILHERRNVSDKVARSIGYARSTIFKEVEND